MKKNVIISDVFCLAAFGLVFIFQIQGSELWFKVIMTIILLVWFIKLIYDIKRFKRKN